MNVARQRRKIRTRMDAHAAAGHAAAAAYLQFLLDLFDAEVSAGAPRPASQFLPMFDEEFGTVDTPMTPTE